MKLIVTSALLVSNMALLTLAEPLTEILERGPHHRVVKTTRKYLREDGTILDVNSNVTELRNGMHYLQNGLWQESQDLVEPSPAGAVAEKGPCKVIFSHNVKTPGGAIDLLTPDNKRLRSTVLGLGYYDTTSGKSVLIAELRDSIGKILPPNQVLYPDCFTDVKADLRFTYTSAYFEADVLLRQCPPPPEDFGLNSQTTRLEVLTEFFDPPLPKKTARAQVSDTGLVSELLEFGQIQLVHGKCFPLDKDAAIGTNPLTRQGAPTGKEWHLIDSRNVLIEAVDFKTVRDKLLELPRAAATSSRKTQLARSLPQLTPPSSVPESMEMLASLNTEPAFVLDWIAVYNAASFVFEANKTYWVRPSTSDPNYEGGFTIANAFFQGKAVIKYNRNSMLFIYTSVNFTYNGDERIYFTAAHDNTIGQQLPVTPPSSPPESNKLYAKPALYIFFLGNGTLVNRAEIRFAQQGIQFSHYDPAAVFEVRNSYFDHTVLQAAAGTGVIADYATVLVTSSWFCKFSPVSQTIGSGTVSFNNTRTDCFLECPEILTQPQSQAKQVGQSVTFSVEVNTPDPAFQWFFNDVPIPGAGGSSYVKSNLQHADAGRYKVRVTRGTTCDPIFSQSALLTITGPPSITVQPQNVTVCPGGRAIFTVDVLGTPPPSFQWQVKSTIPPSSWENIQGATGSELRIEPVGASHHDNRYRVRVSNESGSVISDEAVLTVAPCAATTYNSDAEFAKGYRVNLTSGNNQLQLHSIPSPFPYIWVACSFATHAEGVPGSVVRIDVNTAKVVGEYLTAPGDVFPDASRTTVDRFGNVWIANRGDNLNGQGSITKIGLVIGGTRGTRHNDGSFTPDPDGEYLRPPFLYNTCVDRNGDGFLRTSRGLGHVLPWPNASGIDTDGGVETPEDEAITQYIRVEPAGVRTLALDVDNNLWVGGKSGTEHVKVDTITGLPIVSVPTDTKGGYGGLIDGYGFLWSTDPIGDVAEDPLHPTPIRINTTQEPFQVQDLILIQQPPSYQTHGSYGIAIDPNTQNVWMSDVNNGRVFKWNTDGTPYPNWDDQGYSGGSTRAQGIAIDHQQNLWVSHSKDNNSTTVGHLKTSGLWIGNVEMAPFGNGSTGLAVDSNGKIWSANYNSDNVIWINPNIGFLGVNDIPIGEVDAVVSLREFSEPYNYSDMTGYVYVSSTFPSGLWDFIHEGCTQNAGWGAISWTATVNPPQTGITVEVRAARELAELPRPGNNFIQVQSGDPTGVVGRYLEVRVTLWRQALVNEFPILHSLTIDCPNDCR